MTTWDDVLAIDADDARVVAALDAERRLFEFYGLSAEARCVRLARVGVRVRVTEIGSGAAREADQRRPVADDVHQHLDHSTAVATLRPQDARTGGTVPDAAARLGGAEA